MKTFKNITVNKYKHIKPNTLYFDIETTGFIHTSSFLYMIGMFHLKDNLLHFIFLFCENKSDEKAVLNEFNTIVNNFPSIATFNGKAFDIPYLVWRFEQYNINSSLKQKNSIDMSRDFAPLKNFLGLTSKKQKSYEEFLGHNRKDKYNGGELINIYKSYISAPTKQLEDIITLHNFDDLSGMALITDMYKFLDIKNSYFFDTLDSENEFSIVYKTTNKFNRSYSITKEHFNMKIYDDNFIITTPKIKGSAKLFFKNFKDYFYFPIEDMAVHKSVAKYCKNKIKATAKNCYQNINSEFIPIGFNSNPFIKLDFDDNITLIDIKKFDKKIADNILLNICNLNSKGAK